VSEEAVSEEAVSEDAFDQLAFVWRGAFDTDGERKAMLIGESEDFPPLAAFGRPDREPLFCPREGGVDECLLSVEFGSAPAPLDAMGDGTLRRSLHRSLKCCSGVDSISSRLHPLRVSEALVQAAQLSSRWTNQQD
jgi:hypothetical protein